MAWDHELTGAAFNIAATNANALRVMAGPGTGKSFALKRRVQRLLEEEVDPTSILACTFTRTAAADLRKDLQQLGISGAELIKATTLHALCFSILMREDVLALTQRFPRPLMDFEIDFLLADFNDKRFGRKRDRQKRLNAFNAAWARLQSEQPGWPLDDIDKAFHIALLDWLHFHKAILIGELVPLAWRYLRDNPACEDRNRYDHVLVDEYQDLNVAEQQVAALLSSSGSIAIIGDEDQSIYTFKHAHPEGITTFHEEYPSTHDETLDICRRCPTLIVEMVNSLIEHNESRQPRFLEPDSKNARGEVYVVQWNSLDQEVEGVADYIRHSIACGDVEPGSVLVLTPSRHIGAQVRKFLNNTGIRAVSYFTEDALKGNPSKLNECLSQQTMTFLTLLANPDDRVALRVWCGFGSSSLRADAWRRLWNYCIENDLAPRQVLNQLLDGQIHIAHTAHLVKRYKLLLEGMQQHSGTTGQSLVDELFPGDQEGSEPFRKIAETLETETFDASKLEETVRSGIIHQEIPEVADFVRVMSLHKSKGLTADLVVIVGCVDGLLPRLPEGSVPAEERKQEMEEQRRLFYVGASRTSKTLVLSSVTTLPRPVAHRMRVPVQGGNATHARTHTSRFIHELGPTCPPAITGSQFRTLIGM